MRAILIAFIFILAFPYILHASDSGFPGEKKTLRGKLPNPPSEESTTKALESGSYDIRPEETIPDIDLNKGLAPNAPIQIVFSEAPPPISITAKDPIPVAPPQNRLLDTAQIFAAFASLGALIFLLWQNLLLQRQTKDLTQSIRGSTYQSIVSHYVDINKSLATNSDIAEAFESFDDINNNIPQSKQRQREWLAWWLLNHYENAFMQYQLGALPEFMWKGIEVDCLTQIDKPYISNLWSKSKELFSDDFKIFIENYIAQNKPPTPPPSEPSEATTSSDLDSATKPDADTPTIS
jgi:hypothetical protein